MKGLAKETNQSENDQTANSSREAIERIVAIDEIQRDQIPQEPWFKELLQAHKKLIGFRAAKNV